MRWLVCSAPLGLLMVPVVLVAWDQALARRAYDDAEVTYSLEGPSRVARGLISATAVVALLTMAWCEWSWLGSPIHGDPAGKGLERALRALFTTMAVALQLGGLGLGVGVWLPAEGRGRWAAAVLRALAFLAWTTPLGVHVALELWAAHQGVPIYEPAYPRDLEQVLIGVTVAGFLPFGLALGQSRRRWWAPLGTLLLLPLAMGVGAAQLGLLDWGLAWLR